MRRRAALVTAALAGLLAAPAGAGAPDLWPFHVHDEQPVAGVATRRAAGPLFEAFESADGTRGWVLRPLLGRVESGARSRLEFLYPLGSWRRDEDGWSLRLTPLLELAGARPAARGDDGAPPGWTAGLAFGGRACDGGRYFGVFPFGGVARQRFGLERLDFWLFPLFARARHRDGFQRTYVLWPFFSWGSGAGRRLLRIWPFYGHDVAAGRHDRRFALWPFVHWRREAIGSEGERRVRLFLPFYGESRSAHARSRFVLGPLYVQAQNLRTGARSTDAPWPLVRFAERPARDGFAGSSELRLEPFFRRRRAPGVEHTGVLLGSIEHLRAADADGELERWRLLFVSRFERARSADGAEQVVRDLWPWFRYRAQRGAPDAAPEASAGRLAVPWILPLGGAGFERHWLAPLTFYEHRWRADEARSDWLWGLVRRRSGAAMDVTDVGGWLRFRHASGGEPRVEREAPAPESNVVSFPASPDPD